MNLPRLTDIEEARDLISKSIHKTPILSSSSLDKLLGSTNYLKAEIFQKTGSFKARGALNKILHLSDQEKVRGVIAVSTGNHAQAVAWAARTANIAATVLMPETTSAVKIAAARDYGAEIILHGQSSVEAFAEMERLRVERNLTFIHPFNDFYMIAGAGTIGLELLEQVEHIDNLFVAAGGGGLVSGIAIAIKQINPKIKIIAVQAEGANSLYQSLKDHQIHRLNSINTIADAIAVPYCGELTLAAVGQFVDEVLCVNDNEIRQAMKFLAERCKLVVEPGGAAGLALVLSDKYKTSKAQNVTILSGGNVDLKLFETL